MRCVVEVAGLNKSYGSIRAVKDLSFTVAPGEAVALLGPNGSGKTTLLRCLAGLLHPDSGSVKVCGMDLSRQYRQARRSFSYLPQLASFPAHVTVREVLEFHAKLRGTDPARICRALREVGISENMEDRPVAQLSGGMRQRLSLAVASLSEVELMLLDEPTANLDPEAALHLRKLASLWLKAGRSLFFSTHVLADVEELADRVLVMVDGRVLVQERVSKLRDDLRPFAILRVNVGQPVQKHLDAALENGATSAHLNSHNIIIVAPAEQRFSILQGLERVGKVYHFETDAPSLEYIYMKYVREGQIDNA